MEPGFTPVFDDVAEFVGVTGALVFGLVWRFCQMHNRECYASLKTMREACTLSRRTLQYHLAELCANGMIVKVQDSTPRTPAHYLTRYMPEMYVSERQVQELHP